MHSKSYEEILMHSNRVVEIGQKRNRRASK